MPVFAGITVDGQPAAGWKRIYAACAKHHRFVVEVRKRDDVAEISEQQRKWLHCEAGPIRELMRGGWSFREAKEHVKVEYGRQWFVVELTNKNCGTAEGVFRWECRKSVCRKMVHPLHTKAQRSYTNRYCPHCLEQRGVWSDLYPVVIKSIMDVSVKHTNLWFDEIFAHMPKILPPDPDWKIKKRSEPCENPHS